MPGRHGGLDAARPRGFARDWAVLTDETLARLDDVVDLEGQKVLRIGESLDLQGEDLRPQLYQRIEFLADCSGVRIGTDCEPSPEPRGLPGVESRVKSVLDLSGNTSALFT